MRLERGQAGAATETLAAAFTDDPTWSWMFEGADDPAGALRGVISILIAGGLANDQIRLLDVGADTRELEAHERLDQRARVARHDLLDLFVAKLGAGA